MSAELNRTGHCLCGAVKIIAERKAISLGACHCSICRRWCGGPFMELECGGNVVIEGWENISIYASSSWAERGFCKLCGSHLFMRSNDSDDYGMPAGLFDDDEAVVFDRQVFFDKKPAYYNFANETRNITSDYIYRHYPQCREED